MAQWWRQKRERRRECDEGEEGLLLQVRAEQPNMGSRLGWASRERSVPRATQPQPLHCWIASGTRGPAGFVDPFPSTRVARYSLSFEKSVPIGADDNMESGANAWQYLLLRRE